MLWQCCPKKKKRKITMMNLDLCMKLLYYLFVNFVEIWSINLWKNYHLFKTYINIDGIALTKFLMNSGGRWQYHQIICIVDLLELGVWRITIPFLGTAPTKVLLEIMVLIHQYRKESPFLSMHLYEWTLTKSRGRWQNHEILLV